MKWSADTKTSLGERELERYRRQIMLPGFSLEHQEKLKGAAALVAGVGGLGGTAALYLAAAGFGRLVLVHSGSLTLSNMNRQLMMRHGWIGNSRVVQAKKTVEELNPDVEVDIHDERFTEDNAEAFLDGVDIALSARPNFYERRVLNAACLKKGVPMVEAAMNGMEGYLFNVLPGVTPCMNCVFPDDDPGWEELGFPVLGAVSGALGCFMSIEAIKILSGCCAPLMNRMLIFNTTGYDLRKVNIYTDAECPVCQGTGNR